MAIDGIENCGSRISPRSGVAQVLAPSHPVALPLAIAAARGDDGSDGSLDRRTIAKLPFGARRGGLARQALRHQVADLLVEMKLQLVVDVVHQRFTGSGPDDAPRICPTAVA